MLVSGPLGAPAPASRATAVARGVGHSLRTVVVVAAWASGKATAHAYADVGAGALWVEVLEE